MTIHDTMGDLVGEGFCSQVYAYGQGRVIKLFRDAALNEWAAAEYEDMRTAQQAGLPLPQPYELVYIQGRAGIVMERIHGEALLRQLFTRGDIDDIHTLAAVLYAVHRAALTDAQRGRMKAVKASMQWLIDQDDTLSVPEKSAILTRLTAAPEGQSLCHGDAHPYNVLLRAGRPVLIDWGAAAIGCPAYDVAYVSLILRYSSLPPDTPAQQIDFFNTHRLALDWEFLTHYRRLSGMSDTVLHQYLPIVAAARLPLAASPQEKQALHAFIRRSL